LEAYSKTRALAPVSHPTCLNQRELSEVFSSEYLTLYSPPVRS
jgi:hypothetical protein